MQNNENENKIELTLKSKSQIHYGIENSEKISELKIFIYGLRDVRYIIFYL